MRIGNQNSLLASRNLGETSKAIARSLERLSTGKRVNSARDGVADYSASLGLDSQIRGISQINLGLNRALGMVQVADSAISTQLDIVQRMREIAVEGTNGTLDTSTRKTLNSELQSLLQEFDRITKSTEFDSKKILNGSEDTIAVSLDESTSLSLEISDLSLNEAFAKRVGTGSFAPIKSQFGGDLASYIEASDLNNDGRVDLITTSTIDNAINIMLSNGDGSFRSATSFYGGNWPTGISSGDINNDGVVDLITSSKSDDAMNVYLGNGDGSFQARTSVYGGDSAYSSIAVDLNGDGNLDLVSASSLDRAVNILLGNGDGSFQALSSYGSGTTAKFVRAGDFNGDGILDLASISGGQDGVYLALGNGDGSFQTASSFSTGDNPNTLVIEDFDRDGNLDLATTSTTDDALNILLGNGDGTFQANTSIFGGDSPQYVIAADLNGDDVSDLITASGNDDALNIFLGNGDGTFQANTSMLGGDSTTSVVASDFNRDGVLDLATTSKFDDSLNILLATTTEVSAAASIEVLSAESAGDLIDILDNTVDTLTEARADLGTLYSRIETAQIANLTQQESLTSAKSQIEDADFAVETAELVRNQVLQQAQVAVQSQANVQLQVVLGLLNF